MSKTFVLFNFGPPALHDLVQHRSRLVALRSGLTASVHAVLAKCELAVSNTDLFGAGGSHLVDRLQVPDV